MENLEPTSSTIPLIFRTYINAKDAMTYLIEFENLINLTFNPTYLISYIYQLINGCYHLLIISNIRNFLATVLILYFLRF
jgi:hypothetical protein